MADTLIVVLSQSKQALTLNFPDRSVSFAPYGENALTKEEIASEEFVRHAKFLQVVEVPQEPVETPPPSAIDTEPEEDTSTVTEVSQKPTRKRRDS